MEKIPKFKLVRSFRRSISIHISRDGEVIVKAPYLIPLVMINQFVYSKSDWISKHTNGTTTRKRKKYEEGEEFLYFGQIYKLHIGKVKEITVTDRLNFPDFLYFRIQKELKEWYVKKARKLITERTQHYSVVMKAHYGDIMFSDTSSKWGTCTHENNLQFNWRLVMAPVLVIDYVVVHELAHTFEKNHSKRFWDKVKQYKPAYKQYRKWLTANSHKMTF